MKQDGSPMSITESAIKTIFFFALPGGLEMKLLSPNHWKVWFPGKESAYTELVRNDVAKKNPWCKSSFISNHKKLKCWTRSDRSNKSKMM